MFLNKKKKQFVFFSLRFIPKLTCLLFFNPCPSRFLISKISMLRTFKIVNNILPLDMHARSSLSLKYAGSILGGSSMSRDLRVILPLLLGWRQVDKKMQPSLVISLYDGNNDLKVWKINGCDFPLADQTWALSTEQDFYFING